MSEALRTFLEIPYDKLEEMNLEVKQERLSRIADHVLRERRIKYLTDEKRIKAVTVCFADLEGRLHMVDYDKKFLLKADDRLTFDGSSIRGFSAQSESDLRLSVDWPAFYWLPADVFGPGKVLVFADVLEPGSTPYAADVRGKLKAVSKALAEKDGLVAEMAPEIEGFIFRGRDAERHYHETGRFELISTSGYYHSLPGDPLRLFIDTAAEVQRAMGFANEKDHPEVAPSQFEMNYAYTEANLACDQILLYKLICRQVAARLDMTASFLPKPVTGVNGSGMHMNISLSRAGENLFYDARGEDHLSKLGWGFVERVLANAQDICLVLCPSVNAYRRLDPHYEAPNQIKASALHRGAMIRIPIAGKHSARIEVRAVAPDANPYLAAYVLLRTGLEGAVADESKESRRNRTKFLPDNIHDAIRLFKASAFAREILGKEIHEKYADVKLVSAERCPKALGSLIKTSEIQFHHEVTNQYLWGLF
jgi:glutamine synthetase